MFDPTIALVCGVHDQARNILSALDDLASHGITPWIHQWNFRIQKVLNVTRR
jgi:hypothetical protein